MREAHAPWTRGWDEAAAEAPKLHLETDGRICDTRAGHPVRHDVGPLGRRLLEALESPRDLRALAATLSDAAADGVETALRGLAARGLVFQEGERFLSLVLAQDPPEVDREGFPRRAAETVPAAPALVRRERRAREAAPAS
jgi:hypothetical protein